MIGDDSLARMRDVASRCDDVVEAAAVVQTSRYFGLLITATRHQSDSTGGTNVGHSSDNKPRFGINSTTGSP